MYMKYLLLSLSFVGSAWILAAQPVAEYGFLVGGSGYLGDLNDDYFPQPSTLRLAVGAYGGVNLRPAWLLRAGVYRAEFSGTDLDSDNPDLVERGYSFRSEVWEFSGQLVWEPLAHRRYPAEGGYRNIISPYLFAGFGLSRISPRPNFGEPGTDGYPDPVKIDQAAPSRFLRPTVPVGMGLRFDFSKRTSIGLEGGLRRAFTDYLDGISVAGNPDANDWHAFGGFTLSFRIIKSDFDRDGFVDREDACPRSPGVASARGCPDADGDGVEDIEDVCPTLAGLVEMSGCPDSDYDGLMDSRDRCPDRPGPLSAGGCPDADGDTVADDDDLCPDCPGETSLAGCLDSDGDGIHDQRDQCPNAAGKWELDGCPFFDADHDGVADEDDLCPNRPGPADKNGCPDSDGDGIYDFRDRCPDIAGVAASYGCPPVPEKVRKVLNLARRRVQFETASARLKPVSLQTMDEVVAILQEYDYYHLSIEGHTDSRGGNQANQTLSENRAQSCYEYLTVKGIAPERLSYKGFGESKPIATNRTAAGRQQNRRVEFNLFVPEMEE